MKFKRKMLMSMEVREAFELNKKCKSSKAVLKSEYKKTNTKKISSDVKGYLACAASDIKALTSSSDDLKHLIPVYTHLGEVFNKADELLNKIENVFK
jgi:hypothetical protein